MTQQCPMCGAHNCESMGVLGLFDHFRCNCCGWTFGHGRHQTPDSESDQDHDDETL